MKCKFGNINSECGEVWGGVRGVKEKNHKDDAGMETSCWLNFVTASLFSLTGHRGAIDCVPALVRRMSNRLRIMGRWNYISSTEQSTLRSD